MTMFEDFSASVFAPVLPPNSTSKISLTYTLFVVLILVELLTISVWWCNGWHARRECGRSWFPAQIGSNQRL